MNAFTFQRPATVADVAGHASAGTRLVAGGTTLIDLMKLGVEVPDTVVDINALPLAAIAATGDGGIRIGATARNSDVAGHPAVKRDYPVLSEALLSGASPQLRNMATTGGNLLQRTRCVYFRDTASTCNKREPGSGCDALEGYQRNLAILGTSEHCIASNPSDQNVALVALEAEVLVEGRTGPRRIPIGEFFRLPGDTPQIETVLEPGDLITAVELPAPRAGARSSYLKLRDRASYEFALASAAVVVAMEGETIGSIRIAMGGIGTIPWRCVAAETELAGKRPSADAFAAAAEAVLRDAKPREGTHFKIELAKRCLTAALTAITSMGATS